MIKWSDETKNEIWRSSGGAFNFCKNHVVLGDKNYTKRIKVEGFWSQREDECIYLLSQRNAKSNQVKQSCWWGWQRLVWRENTTYVKGCYVPYSLKVLKLLLQRISRALLSFISVIVKHSLMFWSIHKIKWEANPQIVWDAIMGSQPLALRKLRIKDRCVSDNQSM